MGKVYKHGPIKFVNKTADTYAVEKMMKLAITSLLICTLMFGCSHVVNQKTADSQFETSLLEIQKYSITSSNPRNYSSVEDLRPYNGDVLIRSILNKAAFKYYNTSIVEHLNSKLFSKKLTSIEKKQLENSYTNPTSEKYFQFSKSLGKKYKEVLDRNLEEDENYNDVTDLHLYLSSEINKLFLIEEVQQELIEKVFTQERKDRLFTYFKLIQNNILEKVTPKIDTKWSAQINFYEVVKSTELFWPDLNYLKPFFKTALINGKNVRVINNTDSKNNELGQAYLRYFQQGYSFYTTSNASFGYFGYVDQYTQTMFVQPEFFAKIKNNLLSVFSIIGILAHELGHSAGYFSRLKYEELYRPTRDEIEYFENKILLPFYHCYSSGKSDLDYARVQYRETRSDYIAYLVMKDFKEALKSDDESLYLEMLNLFRKFTTEKIRADDDPHPYLKYREKILSGQCQLGVIYPFTNYNEGM